MSQTQTALEIFEIADWLTQKIGTSGDDYHRLLSLDRAFLGPNEPTTRFQGNS